MNQKQSSTTAEGMALVRAIEASKLPDKRICYDSIARALVNSISVFLSSYQVTVVRVRRADVRVLLPVPLRVTTAVSTVGTEPAGTQRHSLDINPLTYGLVHMTENHGVPGSNPAPA